MTRVRFAHSNLAPYSQTVLVLEELGQAPAHCLVSTPRDNLIEICGKTCYDSLSAPKTRGSADYHAHIIEVGHGSVQEHAVFTFDISRETGDDIEWVLGLLSMFVNRPGVWVRVVDQQEKCDYSVRVTANVRALRQWSKWTVDIPVSTIPGEANLLGEMLYDAAFLHAPFALAGNGIMKLDPEKVLGREPVVKIALVEPEVDEEVYASLFFTGVSRGLSHELVRHKHLTAVSQRSSRFCNEDESDWIKHPVLRDLPDGVHQMFTAVESTGKWAYREILQAAEEHLIKQGADKLTARKQARGAARGVLGNALATELVFTANLKQWKWMIHERAAPAADAEIREVFQEVQAILKERFPDRGF